MKVKLTKKQIMMGLLIGGAVIMVVAIIIMLKPGKNPGGCGAGYKCKKEGSPNYGNCVTSDSCTKVNLVDNPNDCNCTKDCPSPYKPFPSSTDLDNKGNPKTLPQCGYSCNDSGRNDKYCLPNEVCGKVIYKQTSGGTHTTQIDCESKTDYKQCSWDESTKTGVICPITTAGEDPCSPDGKTCKINLCESPNVYTCNSDDDCTKWDPSGKSKCFYQDPKLNNKNITKVGYCKGSSDYLDDKKWCTDIDNISQGINNEKLVCNQKPSNTTHTGVNMNQKCSDQVVNNTTNCTKFGLCPNNNSIAKFDKDGSNCTNDLCCSKQEQIIPKDGSQPSCCSVKVDLQTANCYNTTAHAYSKGLLDGTSDFTDVIQCDPTAPPGTSTNTCINFNPQLVKNAGNKATSSDKTSTNFVSMFCAPGGDKTKGVCKAHCGFLSNNGETTQISLEDSSKGVSYCYPQDNCKLTDNGPDNVNDIPICTHSSSTKKYWNPGVGVTGYSTTWDETFLDPTTCQYTDTTCQKLGSILGVDKSTSTEKGCQFFRECEDTNYKISPQGIKKGSTIAWKDLADPKKLNNVLNQNSTWDYGIAQNPGYKPDSTNTTCLGDPGGYMDTITTPLEIIKQNPQGYYCTRTTGLYPHVKLLQTGEYCPKGVVQKGDSINPTCM